MSFIQKHKKFLIIIKILALILSFQIAGCSGGGNGSSNSDDPAITQEDQTTNNNPETENLAISRSFLPVNWDTSSLFGVQGYYALKIWEMWDQHLNSVISDVRDFDGDGDLDYIASYNGHEGKHGLWVAFNHGNGFEIPVNFNTVEMFNNYGYIEQRNSGNNNLLSDLRDFDGDGDLDYICAQKDGVDGLWVAINNGDPQNGIPSTAFEEPVNWNTAALLGSTNCSTIKHYGGLNLVSDLRDFDGDGDLDYIAEVNYHTSEDGLWILINNGTSFEEPINLKTSELLGTDGSYPYHRVINHNIDKNITSDLMDFDGDGDLDYITYKNENQPVGSKLGMWVILNRMKDDNLTAADLRNNQLWYSSITDFRTHEIFGGEEYSYIKYYQNSPFAGRYYLSNDLRDFDGDGDLDYITYWNNNTDSGNELGLWVAINNGDPKNNIPSTAFNEPVKWDVRQHLGSITGEIYAHIQFLTDYNHYLFKGNAGTLYTDLKDFDGDGDLDFLSYHNHKTGKYGLWVVENNGDPKNNIPCTAFKVPVNWKSNELMQHPAVGMDPIDANVQYFYTPTKSILNSFIDIDDDGDLDLYAHYDYGCAQYGFWIAKNNGTALEIPDTFEDLLNFNNTNYNYTQTVLVDKDNAIWSWGNNNHGQLGNGTRDKKNSPIRVGQDSDWKTVSTGYNHTVAIKKDGTLWAWGSNAHGQLGDNTAKDRKTPVQIGNDTHWTQVSAGYMFSVALKKDGTLWTWGNGHYYQTGTNITLNRHSPTQLGSANDWKMVTAGYFHAMAVKENGTLYGWGKNKHGALGNGTETDLTVPTQIGIASDWDYISAGYFHSTAIKKDGTMWAWGRNKYGQLGNGNIHDQKSPVKVLTNNNFKRMVPNGASWLTEYGLEQTENIWLAVYASGEKTEAIKKDGTIWYFGKNNHKIFGADLNSYENKPVQIGSDQDFVKIIPGLNYSIAVKQNNIHQVYGVNYEDQSTMDLTQLGYGKVFWIDNATYNLITAQLQTVNKIELQTDTAPTVLANGEHQARIKVMLYDIDGNRIDPIDGALNFIKYYDRGYEYDIDVSTTFRGYNDLPNTTRLSRYRSTSLNNIEKNKYVYFAPHKDRFRDYQIRAELPFTTTDPFGYEITVKSDYVTISSIEAIQTDEIVSLITSGSSNSSHTTTTPGTTTTSGSTTTSTNTTSFTSSSAGLKRNEVLLQVAYPSQFNSQKMKLLSWDKIKVYNITDNTAVSLAFENVAIINDGKIMQFHLKALTRGKFYSVEVKGIRDNYGTAHNLKYSFNFE